MTRMCEIPCHVLTNSRQWRESHCLFSDNCSSARNAVFGLVFVSIFNLSLFYLTSFNLAFIDSVNCSYFFINSCEMNRIKYSQIKTFIRGKKMKTKQSISL